ncbi:ABC transporter ATP-binding protein [Micromonospora sp. HM134]|uniref:ABC transporter ATP-binding protein n=1 Tax=unclassified Micromonospora TaxID=2617518 RepID=UPI0011982B3C|nr:MULTISPECIES: ABC transporter ATP-binding protein [unclassified Micromonospora]QDY07977.1 ABC transporter ATP-binding protein [Micromonospora sp. HM134]
MTAPPTIELDSVTVGYDRRTVCRDVSLRIAEGSFTVFIGPNGCGKSTLLRTIARVLRPGGGRVAVLGRDVRGYSRRQYARTVGLLPQGIEAPAGMTVTDLVLRGRHPHRSALSRWTSQDDRAVTAALAATGTTDLGDRVLTELSGGQRQRAWLAMLLAQDTPILLLDEPTTYLDIAHQYEVLDLLADLHAGGRTVVAVLHDLNQAARYATDLVVLRHGQVTTTGHPSAVLTPDLVADVFGLRCRIVPDPVTGTPAVFPESSRPHPSSPVVAPGG